MNIEYDFSELLEFADRLDDFGLFADHMKKVAKEISKALLKRMKDLTPIDEYDLINGWDGNKFLVKEVDNGFEVLIINKAPYATAVNDGHKSYNQYGGPYKIHSEVKRGPFGKLQGRVQVRTPHRWQKEVSDWYVFGHFFVERGIMRLKDTKEIEAMLLRELERWWGECING